MGEKEKETYLLLLGPAWHFFFPITDNLVDLNHQHNLWIPDNETVLTIHMGK